MKRQNKGQSQNLQQFSWFDCIGDIELPHEELQENEQERNIPLGQQKFIRNPFEQSIIFKDEYNFNFQKEQAITGIYPDQEDQKQYFNQRVAMSFQKTAYLQEKKPSQQKNYIKDDKQNEYSKAYRKRKKQHYKQLQQQNQYLKKRIKQLQYRLREQEIQLNRFKYPPPQKQLTVDQLRRQFLQKAVIKLNRLKVSPVDQNKIVYTPKDQFYHEFLDFYAQIGFAGSRKMNLMKYHFDQIFQTILKDSQRYLTLLFTNSKDPEHLQPLQGYQAIRTAFEEVFKLNQDIEKRLMYFVKNLYPLHMQLTKYCSDFYRAFQNIENCSQKIHNFIRQTHLSNMDIGRYRIQLQTWFQFHKYGKLMRKLRSDWLNLVKYGSETIQKNDKGIKGSKKAKLTTKCQN